MTELSCLLLGNAFLVLILMAEIMVLPNMDLLPSSEHTVLYVWVKGKSLVNNLLEAQPLAVPSSLQSSLAGYW